MLVAGGLLATRKLTTRYSQTFTMENGRKTTALVLSGGVVRGFSHLGVLMALENAQVPIDIVTGASVGTIIGAAYAAGMNADTIAGMAGQMNWQHLARPTLSTDGLLSFDRLEVWLTRMFGHLHFEDLAVRFAAIATDMETGRPVVLDSGPLAPAIRASCSVPGVVEPKELNGRFLCDGGVSNNLPIDVARSMGAEYVIAVDVFQHAPRWPLLGPLGRGLTAVEIMVEHSGGLEGADVLITPNLSGKTYTSFGKRDDLVALGQQAAENYLPTICTDLNLSANE
ncbi:MAG: patatin-like phospholipase family protein [Ardenticatenaceae bacterium]|nr:patatin-like phospholipase family protein [Anaerolineales bacterium]MCB8921837.1 patatin-like phospholipase family protein [Ardenticatenaceae bacterium]MCB8991005.1 patatin-like phospholipase family protein [Ardenticatenaceae bacterium]MCB9005315.1 patatin-like phospholipase family protein [Ardenticatenaceae bacterium]